MFISLDGVLHLQGPAVDPRRSKELLKIWTRLEKPGGRCHRERTKGPPHWRGTKAGHPKDKTAGSDSVEDAGRGVTGRGAGVSPWTRPSSSQGQTLIHPQQRPQRSGTNLNNGAQTRRKPTPGSAPFTQSYPEGPRLLAEHSGAVASAPPPPPPRALAAGHHVLDAAFRHPRPGACRRCQTDSCGRISGYLGRFMSLFPASAHSDCISFECIRAHLSFYCFGERLVLHRPKRPTKTKKDFVLHLQRPAKSVLPGGRP